MLNVHDHQFSYLELLAKGIRPEKEIKEMQIRKKQIESFSSQEALLFTYKISQNLQQRSWN